METGGRFEYSAGDDPAGLERLGEELRDKLERDMSDEFGKDFEAPPQFDEEDEKARRAEMSDEERALADEVDQVTENIAQTTQQLATVPLTPEQQILLDRINRLIAGRDSAQDADARAAIDDEIEHTTKQLASLPVTDEQAGLLDDILSLMDTREKLEYSLAELAKTKKK
jgi:hypothetical protein